MFQVCYLALCLTQVSGKAITCQKQGECKIMATNDISKSSENSEPYEYGVK